MKNIAKKLTGAVLVAGLLLGMTAGQVDAVMPPPGEDPEHKIYVDNLRGNDDNDGSRSNPYKTVDWAFRVMNASGAPTVEMYIKGTTLPYETGGGINFKRDNVTVQNWGKKPLIAGEIGKGAWSLPDMALDSQSGILVKNIEFYNVLFDAYTMPSARGLAYDITLQNLTFKVDRPDLMGYHPVVWFHHNDQTKYGQRTINDIKIDRIKIGLDGLIKSEEGFDAIRVENVEGAEIYRNRFFGDMWKTGVEVANSEDVKLAQNTFTDLKKVKAALYTFDETDNSTVYNRAQ